MAKRTSPHCPKENYAAAPTRELFPTRAQANTRVLILPVSRRGIWKAAPRPGRAWKAPPRILNSLGKARVGRPPHQRETALDADFCWKCFAKDRLPIATRRTRHIPAMQTQLQVPDVGTADGASGIHAAGRPGVDGGHRAQGCRDGPGPRHIQTAARRCSSAGII